MGNCCGVYGFDCLCPGAAKSNPEVAGFMYNGPGRGMQYLSQIFLLSAFLYHAERQANCYTDDQLQEEGMRPQCARVGSFASVRVRVCCVRVRECARKACERAC